MAENVADFSAILEVLARHEVEFVVVGDDVRDEVLARVLELKAERAAQEGRGSPTKFPP